MGSQVPEAKDKVQYYKNLPNRNDLNLVAIPFDLNGSEPGDDYEIYTHYENVLGIDFYVTEKLSSDHIFFKHFGSPTENFTEYHFDSKTKFIGKHNE
jgi:hypothetical protein